MVIGAHPAIYYASGFTSSYGLDELEIAGSLLDDPVRPRQCETIDIEVPAEAEMVIEGEVLPDGMVEEGPFGEATGTYAMEGSTEIFKVKAITHRKTHVLRDAVRRRRQIPSPSLAPASKPSSQTT